MHSLAILAAIVAHLTFALCGRYPNAKQVDCSPWFPGAKIHWTDLGDLTQGDYSTGMFQSWDHKQVEIITDNKNKHYWYGIYAGIVNTTAFYAQVDRDGKGQGKQFHLDHKRKDGSVIVSYWITPGVYCIAPLPADYRAVYSVQAWSRGFTPGEAS